MKYCATYWGVLCMAWERNLPCFYLFGINKINMTESTQNTTESTPATVEQQPETVTTATVEQTTEPKATKPKTTKKTTKTKQPEPITVDVESTLEVAPDTAEVEALKAELQALKETEKRLTEEKNHLENTITTLCEEVKITPQKIGQAIRDMGIEPLSVSRENPHAMNIERYMSMSDSERRMWQRTHRADYMKMMHASKIN